MRGNYRPRSNDPRLSVQGRQRYLLDRKADLYRSADTPFPLGQRVLEQCAPQDGASSTAIASGFESRWSRPIPVHRLWAISVAEAAGSLPEGDSDRTRKALVDGQEVSVVGDEVAIGRLHGLGFDHCREESPILVGIGD